jgi:hypothetical protein
LKKADDNRHHKRLCTAELVLEAGPSHWMGKSEDRDDAEVAAELPNTRSTKKRKIATERKTVTAASDVTIRTLEVS